MYVCGRARLFRKGDIKRAIFDQINLLCQGDIEKRREKACNQRERSGDLGSGKAEGTAAMLFFVCEGETKNLLA